MFQVGGQNYRANFAACTLNGRAGYRVDFLRCEASLFGDRHCPIFCGHGRKKDMVLFLSVGFLIKIVVRFGRDNPPVIYGDCFHVLEADGFNSI